jgi:hypothetical protein
MLSTHSYVIHYFGKIIKQNTLLLLLRSSGRVLCPVMTTGVTCLWTFNESEQFCDVFPAKSVSVKMPTRMWVRVRVKLSLQQAVEVHKAVKLRGFHIFWTIGSETAVRLSASRPLPAGKILLLISVRGWVDHRATVRLEGLGQLKNPMTSSWTEPATFQLVA